jgi:hypothetical protein
MRAATVPPLDAVLRPIHAAWVEDVRRFLEPTLEPEADFWTRWAAVRYLADDFRERYRRERELIDALRPLLEPETAGHLARQGDHLVRLRLELDRVGRRRGTVDEVAARTRELLDHLSPWLEAIERAARGIPLDALPPEAAEWLARLEALPTAGG